MDKLKNNHMTSKKGFKTGNFIKKIAKVNGAIAIAFFALVLSGCEGSETIGTVESTEQASQATNTGDTDTTVTGNTGAAKPSVPGAKDGTDASTEFPNSELVGKTVTVSTKVKQILGPKAFVVYDIESLRGQEVLVVSNQDAPAVGTNIELTGVMNTFDAASIKKDYGFDLAPEVVKAYTNRPYLAAKAMEKVD
ncbi:hypothetical protein NIES267_22280 [Calothrix parasitica NIES-267]|uniref:Uncharacterized protein n=1 Tax=Calothrix parasitica NIES-267 TaxID=1973488 RepID=A0A1Z4LNI5_9CYAN|nr:hypothetical protein NIES267_22280 [Calothrix parasitica NIES-267]